MLTRRKSNFRKVAVRLDKLPRGTAFVLEGKDDNENACLYVKPVTVGFRGGLLVFNLTSGDFESVNLTTMVQPVKVDTIKWEPDLSWPPNGWSKATTGDS